MGRYRIITIDWSYPIRFENRANSKHIDDEYGIYVVTRKIGGKESNRPMYIGLTSRSFEKRMDEHEKRYELHRDNFRSARGTEYVRFGTISSSLKGCTEQECKQILEDTETHFIWEYNPVYNKNKVKSAIVGDNPLIFRNTGYRWHFSSEETDKEVKK